MLDKTKGDVAPERWAQTVQGERECTGSWLGLTVLRYSSMRTEMLLPWLLAFEQSSRMDSLPFAMVAVRLETTALAFELRALD